MATLITKNSSTAAAVPGSGDLVQGELAVNVTDKKLYTKDAGGNIVKVVGSLGNQEADAANLTGPLSINGAAGTSGQVLTSQGSGVAPAWSALSTVGGFSNIAVFTTSGTWSVPAGITKCKVTVTGGGGSGTSSNAGGGGNAGGTAIKILSLSGGSATVTVGTGGAPGNGGTSSFVYGVTTVSATGGNSGGAFEPSSTVGVGAGGDINLSGGFGGMGTNTTSGNGGSGGASFWGGGGGSSNSSTAIMDAQAYGAGGGSIGYTGGALRGGYGKEGIVVIEY